MGVADWLPKGRWVCFSRKDGRRTRAIRRTGLVVRVYAADAGKAPRLTEHRFVDANAERAFVARFHLTQVHHKCLWPNPSLEKTFEPPDDVKPRPTRAHAARSTRTPSRDTSRRATRSSPRATDVQARAFTGDAHDTALGVKATITALQAAGAEVRARLGRPASARALARLESALGRIPSSLRAILEVHDGFDVQWRSAREKRGRGETHVTCTWLPISKMLAGRVGPIVPMILQYDGAIVGLDTEAPRGGELRVVFRERLDPEPRGIATSAGAFLAALLRDAFTHPKIPDVAHRAASALGRSLV
ncbi:MAG: SMI1/KNR4 family protein [Sandaracinaceae bacterium]|nr:SMI1/KNR4 family protein [Sandaracinaceae bacterium]